MQAITNNSTSSLEILQHDLAKHFPDLAKFNSTPEMQKSGLYQQIKPQIDKVLNAVVGENFAPSIWVSDFSNVDRVRALAWNIERGKQIRGIIDALHDHRDLRGKDLYLLTELDYGMARAENLFIAREIALSLKLNYVFAPCYIALNKGSGTEAFIEEENTFAIHGLAMLSRYRISNAHVVDIPNGKDKMFGAEKRLGNLKAIIADIEHPIGTFRAVVVHLDAHSSRSHRVLQIKTVLDHLETLQPQLPIVFAGDWNTTTHNSQNARRAILGYWRRILMGVKNVAKNHYPFPERFFEKSLFDELDGRGFDWREFNEIGAGTLHYDMNGIAENTNLGEWIPAWCFPFIRYAANQVGGKVSLKLDWFTGRNIRPAADFKPKVVGNLRDGETPLSDHDAIVLDFTINN